MKKNMGSADKMVRFIIAAVIAVLYFFGDKLGLGEVMSGTLGLVLLIVAIIFAATSLISFCPLYTILGIKTNKKEDA